MNRVMIKDGASVNSFGLAHSSELLILGVNGPIHNTICIYHSRDLDGWMSAANVKKWFNQQEVPNKKGEDINTLDFLGWDYGDEIPNMSDYNEVIMVDISFPGDVMEVLYDNNKLIWIDHHSSAIEVSNSHGFNHNKAKGMRDSDFAACELTWKYFFPNETMPELVRLLGRYDCFGHKGTEEEQDVLEFQYGARQSISNHEEAFTYLQICINDARMYAGGIEGDQGRQSDVFYDIFRNGKAIYKYLCTDAKQTYAKSFPIYFTTIEQADPEEFYGTEPKGTLHIHKFLAVNQERFNPINFGIDYHKEGYDGYACFWYKNGKWSWSLYNDDGKLDCSLIAKKYSGGGHKGASGFVVDDLNNILNNKNENSFTRKEPHRPEDKYSHI